MLPIRMKGNHETIGRLIEFDPQAKVVALERFVLGFPEDTEIFGRCAVVALDVKRREAERLRGVGKVHQGLAIGTFSEKLWPKYDE